MDLPQVDHRYMYMYHPNNLACIHFKGIGSLVARQYSIYKKKHVSESSRKFHKLLFLRHSFYLKVGQNRLNDYDITLSHLHIYTEQDCTLALLNNPPASALSYSLTYFTTATITISE